MIPILLLCTYLITPGIGQLIGNLAVNKTTSQSTTFADSTSSYPSRLAVDGNILTGFSQTNMQADQWLIIDLQSVSPIGVVELYNREKYLSRFSNISLLTSNETSPPNPALLDRNTRIFNSPWTEQWFQEKATADLGIISLQNINARYIAIFSSGKLGIILKEVLIFADICYNLAEMKVGSQSTDMNSRLATYGNDGFLSEYSFTQELQYQYWMVSLLSTYEVYKVVIYGRIDCCRERYSNWSVLTNDGDLGLNGPTFAGYTPNRIYSDFWKEVAFISEPVGEKHEVMFRSQSASHVAVFNVGSPAGIYLREFQVFGCQCELISMVSKAKMEASKHSGCVTLSWSITHQYCLSTTFKYEYLCDGQKTWISQPNVYSGDVCSPSYGKVVTCQMRICLGNYCYSNKLSATSTSCQRPSIPTDYSFQLIRMSEKFVDVSVSWKVSDPNCVGITGYEVSVTGPNYFTQNSTIPNIELLKLDPCSTYTVAVTATNDLLMSSHSVETLRNPVIIASRLVRNSSVTATSAKCLDIQLGFSDALPTCLYSKFKVNCTGVSDVPVRGKTSEVCGLTPGSDVKCKLVVIDDDFTSFREINTTMLMPIEANTVSNEVTTVNATPFTIATIVLGVLLGLAVVALVLVVTFLIRRRKDIPPSENQSPSISGQVGNSSSQINNIRLFILSRLPCIQCVTNQDQSLGVGRYEQPENRDQENSIPHNRPPSLPTRNSFRRTESDKTDPPYQYQQKDNDSIDSFMKVSHRIQTTPEQSIRDTSVLQK